ncbi:MAG TPA: histidine kinase [Bacteroidales bacterium]|nr:histidine kinase [Bacteroidales bacterium]
MQNTRHRKIYITGHVVVWGLVFMLPFVFQVGQNRLTFSFLTEWTIDILLSAGIFYLFYGYVIRIYLNSDALFRFFLVSAAAFIGYCLLELAIDYLTYPLKNSQRPFNGVSSFAGSFIINMFIVGVALLVLLFENWFSVQRYRQEVERERLEGELKMLRFQVNPHFLFNTLNNIYTLVYKKSDRAPEAILKLSSLMRYMLYETDGNKVPLSKELEYLQNFVELQRLRLVSNQQVNMKVEGNADGYEIAPLLLVPFIENAFKHGIRATKDTLIVIDISVADGILNFRCKNDYRPDISSQINSGIGLSNVKKRLEMIYKGHYQLNTDMSNNKYVVNLIIAL